MEGGPLSASIFASHLAIRGLEIEMMVPDSRGLLVPGWKAVSVAGHVINNGYHALEVGRAPELGSLLTFDLNLPLSVDARPMGIWIRGQLISLDANPEFWPSELFKADAMYGTEKKHLTLAALKEVLSEEGAAFFGFLGSRYSDTDSVALGQFLPWFLPSVFTIDSDDEGDVYRNLVRSGAIKSTRLFPSSGIFEQLSKDLEAELRARGMRITNNPTMNEPLPPAEKADGDAGKRDFYCSLFELSDNRFGSFAEIIVADEIAPELSRVSILPGPIPNLLLCESYHLPGARPNPEEWVNQIEAVGACKANFLGSELTRTMKMKAKPADVSPYALVASDDVIEVKFLRQGPINMAKASAIAHRALREVGTI